MKKIISTLVILTLVTAMSISTLAIELPDGDLLGHWKLDGDLKNEVAGGPSAEYVGFLFDDPLYDPEDYVWIEGVDGYAWKSETSVKDGIRFAAPSGQSVTIMEWVRSENCPFTTPLIWWGEQNQSNALGLGGEAWIGVWPEFNEDWGAKGPCIGSNNAAGNRIAVYPSVNPFSGTTLPWTHIAITIDYDAETGLSYGKLYYNGQLVGEGGDLPYVQSDSAYVYFGVNAWNWCIDGYLDEVIIYNEVLTDDEIAGIYAQYSTPSEEIVEITAAPETEAPETDPETEAPETDPETEAPETDPVTTDAPAEEKGCGSSVGMAAVIVTVVSSLGCALIKRR